MAEYIKKEDIEQKIQDGLNNLVLGHDAIEILGMIYEMPTADVAPVRHGRWLDGKCTACGWEEPDVCTWIGYDSEAWIETPYCSNCGASMDGGNDD